MKRLAKSIMELTLTNDELAAIVAMNQHLTYVESDVSVVDGEILIKLTIERESTPVPFKPAK